MSTELINSRRFFQLWSYSVSHGELIFRSTKSDLFLTRIDILFKGVTEFHLPTTSTELLITEASDIDIRNLHMLSPASPTDTHVKVYVVKGRRARSVDEYSGYIIALAAFTHEDEGEYYEPSFFDSLMPQKLH
ncbi:MAG TPA: hypothetical protein VGH16_23350 [Candidatus Binatia bacterium]|jgi:hypothetical protein